MGKFDGMDPQLVRELLAETKQAAVELREVEGRVSQIMSRAGLATQTTHRPVQVADSADRMVKDVSARLDLLEKRAVDESPSGDSRRTDPPTDKPGTDQKPDKSNPDTDARDGKPDGNVRDGKPDGGQAGRGRAGRQARWGQAGR
ncbi:hypothetical protein ACFSTC_46620 [Nonomuraea ferruginea]